MIVKTFFTHSLLTNLVTLLQNILLDTRDLNAPRLASKSTSFLSRCLAGFSCVSLPDFLEIMKKYIFILFAVLLCEHTDAQVTGQVNTLDNDLFYINYTPETKISSDIGYQRGSTKLNFPVVRSDTFSIFSTLGLDIHDFNFTNSNEFKGTNVIDRFYNVNYSTFLIYKFSEKWSLNTLLSTFITADFEKNFAFDDLEFNGNIFAERTFLREKGGYYKLGLGVGYMTLNGITQVNPIIQLKSRLNEEWSFVLGLPNTYIKWDFHKNHSLKILGELNDFYANLNTTTNLLSTSDVSKITYTTASAGLEYNAWLTSSLAVMIKGTYPVWGDYEVRDGDDNSLFEFDTSFEKPFIGFGIKFNPIRTIQNSVTPL